LEENNQWKTLLSQGQRHLPSSHLLAENELANHASLLS